MKFSDGYWRVREGFTAAWARQTHDIAKTDNGICAHASANLVNGRGDSLGGPVFTVTLSTPAEGIIKVVEEHFRGAVNPDPHFHLNIDEDANFDIETGDGATVFRAGSLEVAVSNPGEIWSMDFRANGHSLTGTSYKGLGAYTEQSTGIHYMREQLRLALDEKVYGFGE